MSPRGEHDGHRRRVQHLVGDAADGEPAERPVPGGAQDDERRLHLGGGGDEPLGGRRRGPGHVLRPHRIPEDPAGFGDRLLGVLPQELGVFGVHAGQGRVPPHLGEDHAHGQGNVARAGQHPAQSEGVLPAPVGGEADEVPHRAPPCYRLSVRQPRVPHAVGEVDDRRYPEPYREQPERRVAAARILCRGEAALSTGVTG